MYIRKAFDLMKSMDQESEEKDIICLVCEGLIKGLDINQAIEDANSNRLSVYLDLMGTEARKDKSEEQKILNREKYKKMVNSDRENIKKIKEVAIGLEEVQEETEELIMTEGQNVPEKNDDNNDKKENKDKNDKGSKGIRDSFIARLRNLGGRTILGAHNITENPRYFNGAKKSDKNHWNGIPKITGIR